MVEKLAAILLIVIGVIVSLAILPDIAHQTEKMSEKLIVTDDIINIASARNETGHINISVSNFTITTTNIPSGWEVTNCPIALSAYGNITEDFTLDTDYRFYSASGIVQVLSTAKTNKAGWNLTYADYTYCDDAYVSNEAGRAITKIILIFAGLALVATVIFYGIKEWL